MVERHGGQLRARMRAGASKRKRKAGDGPGRLSFASMISFTRELKAGEEPISQAEFERLVALKQPLVRVRGQWVALDPEQIKRAAALFKGGGDLTMAEALRLGLGGATPEPPAGVAYDGLEAEGAFGELLRDLSASQRLGEVPQPAGFTGELRPYQRRGLSWLAFMRRAGMGACLADDMGLGKSPQTIALLLHDLAERPDAGPALLVAPTSVVGNWRRELERFAPGLRVHVHQGAERLRGEALAAAQAPTMWFSPATRCSPATGRS